MDKNSMYFNLSNSPERVYLSDRIAFNWKEVLLYPLPLSVGLMLFFMDEFVIIGIVIGLLFGFLYAFFRAFAWIFYKEFIINKRDHSVRLNYKALTKLRRTVLIDKQFDPDKVQFIKLTRSGKTNYLLRYQTYKPFDVMVLKSTEHKALVEEALS